MSSRVSKNFLLALVIVAGLFVVAFLMFVISPLAKNQIPPSFNESHTQASLLADDIVEIFQGATDTIVQLQQKGVAQGHSELTVVLEEIQNVKTAREKASLLAKELETMAIAVPEVSPDAARQTAIIAISSEAALINKIISYGEDLNQLLSLLKDTYVKGKTDYDKINNLVDQLNAESGQINEFNAQFVRLMKKFDEYYQE
jgi:hypothetical protein